MVTTNSALEGRAVGATGFATAAAGSKARKISTAGDFFSGLYSTLSLGSVKVKTTSSPCCAAVRSVTATGIGDLRSAGSPGAPQPTKKQKAKMKTRNSKMAGAGRVVSTRARLEIQWSQSSFGARCSLHQRL